MLYCYHLNFLSPFHIDSKGNNFYTQTDQMIHSDTLSSAVALCWARLYGSFPYTEQNGAPELPYQVSSCFPTIKGELFLPKPAHLNHLDFEEAELRKKLKSIKWLGLPYWKELASWQTPNQESVQRLKNNMQHSHYCCSSYLTNSPLFAKHSGKIADEMRTTRVATDRITDTALDSQLFDFSATVFAKEAGLFFLARFDNQEAKNQFDSALALLGDEGIGADRANGLGHFYPSPATGDSIPQIQLAEQGEHGFNISLATPQRSEITDSFFGPRTRYDLMNRGGWIENTGKRKNRIWAFTEGSEFEQSFTGQICDITPDILKNRHVYRDLRAMCVAAV